VKHNF